MELLRSLSDQIALTFETGDHIIADIRDLEQQKRILDQRIQAKETALKDAFVNALSLVSLHSVHYGGNPHKIQLIKMMRMAEPTGLKDAKNFVERFVQYNQIL